eukprot:COSAG01_NODE_3132_length_6532_cov_6.151873_9_plen_86_part_00
MEQTAARVLLFTLRTPISSVNTAPIWEAGTMHRPRTTLSARPSCGVYSSWHPPAAAAVSLLLPPPAWARLSPRPDASAQAGAGSS